jgi:hypothetical protein
VTGTGGPHKAPVTDQNHGQHTALLELRRPDRPAGRLPALLARLLPDVEHEGGWARFTGADVGELTAAERARERSRLLVALALLPDNVEPPAWIHTRLRWLGSAA